ncbi:MAG: hypothetical protein WDN06_16785 [Asticcacaulis sp.]
MPSAPARKPPTTEPSRPTDQVAEQAAAAAHDHVRQPAGDEADDEHGD